MISDTRIKLVLSTILYDKFIPPSKESMDCGINDGSMDEYIVLQSNTLPQSIVDKAYDSCIIKNTEYVIYQNDIFNRNLLFYYL